MKQHAGGWTLRSARARSIRHVVCCGLTFLALVQASGCEDDGSPAAPTLTPLATNRSPSPSGSIPGQALTVGRIAATVDMALYFTDPDGDALAYTATSGDTRVLIASVTGSTVVLNPVSAGGATATVMVTDPGGLTATQLIAVTVDHGDTRDTAAPVSSNDNTQGALEGQGDVDYFGLVISSLETLTIETTGDTDTFGELESDDGLTIASADRGGDGGNFRIRQQVQTGTYYIRVSGATPAETGPYMLEVSETLGPDLVVESPGVTRATVDPEGSFNLSATVSNDGDEGSAATALRYYRSTDATITTSDTQVGTDAVGALSASGTSAESIGLTAPASAGRYYYGACVDAVSGESSTTNNCSSSVQVDVTAPPPQTSPDLTVGSPSVNDDSPETGGSFTLSATVSNSGDGASPATTLRYYQSTDATISSADTQVGTDAVGTLAASGTSAESISLTAPASAGTYYFGACVDAVSGESSTTNNCSGSVQVTVSEPPAGPDLDPYAIVVATSPGGTGPGGNVGPSVGVRNDGDESSAATTVRFYQSTDATITTADTEVGTNALGALSPGATASIGATVSAPSTPGTFYYGACVDAVAGESDTTNNCSSSVQVDVTEPPPATTPDLTVGSPSVDDSSPETGGSFTLSATVSNDGDGAAATTTLRYYRSTDATITSSDTEVGTDAVGVLSASGTSAESIGLTAPASAGRYYYGACVDAVSGESSTTNNCSSSVQVDVTAPPPQTSPDLTVGSPSVNDDSPETGGSFTLSATVSNSGDAEAAATTLRYYRSTDVTITTSDTEVGTDAVGVLSASGTSAESIDLTASATAGTYYYGACVDAATGESSTTNNCSGSVTLVVQGAQPDLTVNLSITPPVGGIFHVGSSFGVGATVSNAGDAASPATTLRYYLSKDAPLRTPDTQVGTDAVAALAAPGASAESISLTAPSTPGKYYYNACVDAVAGESNTINNCSFVSIAVTVLPEADLVVGSPSVTDSSPETGESFTLSATVSNAGDGASAATTLRYYRSTDATISSADTQVGTDALWTLAASGTSAESISLTAPNSAGTYYYGACVDAVSGESSSTNNCSSSVQVDVIEPPPSSTPDLTVGSPSVTNSTPNAGDIFDLSATVSNDGDGASPATTLRYYRSTDATITTSDTQVGTDAVGALTASATSTGLDSVRAPATPGTYYYGACVDAVTWESDTTNNCSSSVQVTVSAAPPGPDLDPYAVSVLSGIGGTPPGGRLNISIGVRNEGDEASAATTVRFYQSTDATITTSDTEVGTNTLGELSAGATTSIGSGPVSASSSAGTFYYGACVDSVTGESDTTNNCSGSVSVVVSG